MINQNQMQRIHILSRYLDLLKELNATMDLGNELKHRPNTDKSCAFYALEAYNIKEQMGNIQEKNQWIRNVLDNL